jgi:hydrogenase maturation protease
MANSDCSNALQSAVIRKRLIVGIGSPHGDDRAGWTAIEQLQSKSLEEVELRQAKVPHDVIDWIDECTEVHIIDCCRVKSADLILRRFEWSDTPIDNELNLRSAGSHQIDIISVLRLAASLNRLPVHVVLWAIPGQCFDSLGTLSADCSAVIAECVERITQELGGA